MKIFIGNLGAEVTSYDLFRLFAKFGDVADAHVATDGGNSKGFGYVLMKRPEDGEKAILALNKKKFMDQFLSVSEAIETNTKLL